MAFPTPPLPKFNRNSFAIMRNSEPHLLPQQKEALARLVNWFQQDSVHKDNIALVSMPTGSGKTGIISCLPYYLGSIGLIEPQELCNQPTGVPLYKFDKPVLVIAPDLAIAKQLEGQLSVSESGSIAETFVIRRGIVPKEMHKDILPIAKKIESTAELRDQYPLKKYDMIIANAQKFLPNRREDSNDWQELPNDIFRVVVVDEAHHYPAVTWRRIVEKFQGSAQVVFFTATPYRSDGKKVLENTPMAYHLPLADAVRTGIIRETQFEELLEIDLLEGIQIDRASYSNDDIQDMGRMVTVLQKVKQLLDLKNGDVAYQFPGGVTQHMAMAIASDVNHATRLLELWRAIYPGIPAEMYHSDINMYEKEQIMKNLKENALRLVIVVQMLLEGFDYPPISIAAITYKIGSPVKFVQFVGRAQRIYRGPEGTFAENGHADIITHVDYVQSQNYNNFQNETLIPVSRTVT